MPKAKKTTKKTTARTAPAPSRASARVAAQAQPTASTSAQPAPAPAPAPAPNYYPHANYPAPAPPPNYAYYPNAVYEPPPPAPGPAAGAPLVVMQGPGGQPMYLDARAFQQAYAHFAAALAPPPGYAMPPGYPHAPPPPHPGYALPPGYTMPHAAPPPQTAAQQVVAAPAVRAAIAKAARTTAAPTRATAAPAPVPAPRASTSAAAPARAPAPAPTPTRAVAPHPAPTPAPAPAPAVVSQPTPPLWGAPAPKLTTAQAPGATSSSTATVSSFCLPRTPATPASQSTAAPATPSVPASQSYAPSTPASQSHAPTTPASQPAASQPRASASQPTPADDSGWNVVYADWYFQMQTQQLAQPCASCGVWFDNEAIDHGERIPGVQTGPRAQLIAIARALEIAHVNDGPLRIKTGSKYAVQAIRDWLPGFIRNGWRTQAGAPVQNRPLLEYIGALLDFRGVVGQRVELALVDGQPTTPADIEGFQNAQYLAQEASTARPASTEPDWDALRRGVEARGNAIMKDGAAVPLRAKNAVASGSGSASASEPKKSTSTIVWAKPKVEPDDKENALAAPGLKPGKKSMLESANRALERRTEPVDVIEIDDDTDDFNLTEDQLAALDQIEAVYSQSSQPRA